MIKKKKKKIRYNNCNSFNISFNLQMNKYLMRVVVIDKKKKLRIIELYQVEELTKYAT
jgi:hypothetical protein